MKIHENIIAISIGNLSLYGFACFPLPSEPNLKDGFWFREIELRKSSEVPLQKFKIPEFLLVEISDSKKITKSENYGIQSRSDIAPVKLLSERAGWNQTKADLEAIAVHENGGYQFAFFRHMDREIPFGCGLSLPVSKDMSWIGMVLVHPELRRQGVAGSIMNSCIEQARLVQHKSVVGLDATPQGKQVYDALGFKDSYQIWRCDIATIIENKSDRAGTIKPFSLPSIEEYLIRKNNAERHQIVELLNGLPDSFNRMSISEGSVNGFIMSRPGRIKPFIGPLIADSKETAYNLLIDALYYWNKQGFASVFIDIPVYHLGDKSIFFDLEHPSNPASTRQVSIQKLRSFVRMYQLIAESEIENYLQKSTSEKSKAAVHLAAESFEKTQAFMEKERNEILPAMYAIGGPEMS